MRQQLRLGFVVDAVVVVVAAAAVALDDGLRKLLKCGEDRSNESFVKQCWSVQ